MQALKLHAGGGRETIILQVVALELVLFSMPVFQNPFQEMCCRLSEVFCERPKVLEARGLNIIR